MLARYRGASKLAAALCGGVLWLVFAAPPAAAQEQPVDKPAVEAEAAATAAKAKNGQQPDQSGERPGGKPGPRPDGKPDEGGENQEEGEKPNGKSEKKPDEPPPTRRPTEPADPADPAELNVQPDDDGLISFSFRGQPWPAVLEWLADLSHMSLEWQEAPAGFLDLTTRRKYTVPEVRDLINSVLLARGYTLLRSGEILLVVKLEDLDVSLVPRVTNEKLDERGTYEIVKTFFDLNRLRAETVAEELKPLLSPHGKITPLKTTNRLEVVETAGNLRRLRDLLADEQDASGQEFQVREFPLRHVRADDVLETLNTLLGIDSKKSAAPMTPEQMQQQQEQMRRAMEQAQRQGGQAPQPSKDEPEIFLAVNRRNNSVVAHAAPDKLAIIEQSVRYLDVPQSRPSSVSPLAGLARIRNYRLNGAQPAAVIKVLQEMGNLSPTTQLVTDDANQAIIANAPMVDHITIGALVEQLNGSGRSFEVVQLRRLDAEYVAGSIEFLMRGPPENNNSRRSYWWRDPDEDKEEDKFQVEADTQNNRLLLRANEVELEEIRQLLIKLGEDPYSQPQGSTMRVIRATPGVETERLIERLRRLWPTVGPNPLEVDPGESQGEAEDGEQPDDKKPEKEDKDDTTPVGPVNAPDTKRDTVAGVNYTAAPPPDDSPASRLWAANFADAAAQVDPSAAGQQPTAPPRADDVSEPGNPEGAPISITRGPQGLVITSRDTEALAAIMDLVDQIHASQPSFRVFQLRHTYASDIALLLEDVFEDKEEDDSNRFSPYFFYYDDRPSDDNARSRLSSRRPLKFIPDSVTNTVLVQNADDGQLAEIEQLIEMYDRVEPPDSQSVRKTQMVQVRFGDAPGIAAVVKDVFLDLLSPNDEALTKNRQQQEQPRERFSYFGSTTSSDDEKLPRFKGLLSVGVDAEANMLVVSAPQFLLTDVVALIGELDDAARPNMPVVRVMQPGAFSNALINSALTGAPAPGAAQSSKNTETRRNGDRARAERWREERRRDRDRERGDE